MRAADSCVSTKTLLSECVQLSIIIKTLFQSVLQKIEALERAKKKHSQSASTVAISIHMLFSWYGCCCVVNIFFLLLNIRVLSTLNFKKSDRSTTIDIESEDEEVEAQGKRKDEKKVCRRRRREMLNNGKKYHQQQRIATKLLKQKKREDLQQHENDEKRSIDTEHMKKKKLHIRQQTQPTTCLSVCTHTAVYI